VPAVLEIIIRVAEILTIIAGSAGVCLSLMLLFSPGLILKANRTLNQPLLTDSQLAALNPSVNSESFVLRHHAVCSVPLIAGSSYILLIFFIMTPVPARFGLFTDMALECLILLGKTAGVVGLAAGLLLFFSPAAVKALGQKANICFDTEPVFNGLDTVCVDVHAIIMKYSCIFGLVGMAVSAALIIISVVNFLGTSASLGGRM